MHKIQKIFGVFFVTLVVLLTAGGSFAQGNTTPEGQISDLNSIMDTLSKLPPKVQEELMAESEQVKAMCQSKQFFSSFHDCECISLQFLSRRMSFGPEPTQGLLLFEVSKMCVNRTGAAGYSYNYCLKALESFTGKIGAACTCVARRMVKTYEAAPNPDINYVRGLYMNGLSDCKVENYLKSPSEQIYEQQQQDQSTSSKTSAGSYRQK